MKQKTTQILYSYWNDVRGRRRAPKRFDIEPSRIAPILPETFILEDSGNDRYRFRLAGTRICELFCREFRGRNLIDMFEDADQATLLRQLACASEQAPALLATIHAITADGRDAAFELLILPLIHSDDRISRFLGCLTPLEQPDWLGSVAPVRHVLGDHELIWPDGRPHSVLTKLQSQSPFAAELKGARLVTSERRKFRVLDGGLAKSEDGKRS